MTVLSLVILAIIVATVVVGVIMLVRNEMVYRYRIALLKDMSRAAQSDIRAARPWKWRYDVYDSVSHDEMVWRFWRRFKSFYPDQSFRRSA